MTETKQFRIAIPVASRNGTNHVSVVVAAKTRRQAMNILQGALQRIVNTEEELAGWCYDEAEDDNG